MWNQLSSASSANSNRNGHENGHRIVTFRARFVFLWHFGHRIAAFRARFGFGPFRWYIFGQVCKIMLDLDGSNFLIRLKNNKLTLYTSAR